MARAGHTKRRRHSSLDDLPADVLQQVEDMILEREITYDDIKAFLDEKGFDISRSAIGRYGQAFFDEVRELKIVEEKARTMISEAGGDGLILEEAGAKLLAKRLITILMESDLDPKSLNFAMDAFAKLQRSSVSREKLKADFDKKAAKAMEAIEKKTGKKLTPETLAYIKEQIYGLV